MWVDCKVCEEFCACLKAKRCFGSVETDLVAIVEIQEAYGYMRDSEVEMA